MSEMTAIPVQITMDDEDFTHLVQNSSQWAASVGDHTHKGDQFPGWRTQTAGGRFEVPSAVGEMPVLHWKIAYWMGTEYTTVILAKAFLAARGFDCQVVWDLAEPGEWTILTDYDHMWQELPVAAQQ